MSRAHARWLKGNLVVSTRTDVKGMEFSKQEVEEELFQMHPLKVPGPDGLQNYSFKNISMLWARF